MARRKNTAVPDPRPAEAGDGQELPQAVGGDADPAVSEATAQIVARARALEAQIESEFRAAAGNRLRKAVEGAQGELEQKLREVEARTLEDLTRRVQVEEARLREAASRAAEKAAERIAVAVTEAREAAEKQTRTDAVSQLRSHADRLRGEAEQRQKDLANRVMASIEERLRRETQRLRAEIDEHAKAVAEQVGGDAEERLRAEADRLKVQVDEGAPAAGYSGELRERRFPPGA